MIDFKREYRDTQEMIDKIDIFLSKNKEDYNTFILSNINNHFIL